MTLKLIGHPKRVWQGALARWFPKTKIDFEFSGGAHVWVSRHFRYRYSGPYEESLAARMIKLSRGCRVFMDVGAYFGYWSLFVRAHSEGRAVVVGFEPNPNVYSWLSLHFEMNAMSAPCGVEPLALSFASGNADFNFSEECTSGSLSDEVCQMNEKFYSAPSQKVNVGVTTIDEYVSRTGLVPDLIKIDSEGHEHEILKGARTTLEAHHSKMMVEVHPEQLRMSGSSEELFRADLSKYFDHVETVAVQENGIKTFFAS